MPSLVFSDTRPVSPAIGTVRIGLPVDVTAPVTPQNFLPTRASGAVLLSWDASSDEIGVVGYHVYKNGVLLASPVLTSYLATGLTDGTEYEFTLDAFDAAGNASEQTTVLSTPNPPGIPGQVVALTAAARNAQVLLAWSAPADNGGALITDYTISYRTGAAAFAAFAHAASNARSITVTGLVNDTAYDFKVAAVNSFGAGPASAVVSCTPFHPINLLTVNEASLETNTAGWVSNAGTIARSTLQAAHGSASLSITQTGVTNISAHTGNHVVAPGTTYTALASSRTAVTPRYTYVALQFLTADGTSVVGTFIPDYVPDTATGWTDLAVSGVAPAEAGLARVVVAVPSTDIPLPGEVHYYDKVGLFSGSVLAGDWVSP